MLNFIKNYDVKMQKSKKNMFLCKKMTYIFILLKNFELKLGTNLVILSNYRKIS